MNPPPKMAPGLTFAGLWRVARRACVPALVFALAGCGENIAAPPVQVGPDTVGPVMHLAPPSDTLADSVGILLVHLTASDRSGIKRVDFFVLPAISSFPQLLPLDTAVDVFYSVRLAQYKHGFFRYYARSADLLDHETVTDTVTVTVR